MGFLLTLGSAPAAALLWVLPQVKGCEDSTSPTLLTIGYMVARG